MAKKPYKLSGSRIQVDALRTFQVGFLSPIGMEVRTCRCLAKAGLMDINNDLVATRYRTNAAGREALAGSEGKGK